MTVERNDDFMRNTLRRLKVKMGMVLLVAGSLMNGVVSPPCLAQPLHRDDVVEVTNITGFGVDYQSALNDALRLAIAKGKGAKIWSRTMVKDAVTISDRINTVVNGFIEDFEIGDHGPGSTGPYPEYRLTLTKVKVHLKEIPIDESVPELLRRSGNPRYILVSTEKWIDDREHIEQEWKVASDYIKERMKLKGFRIIEEGLWSGGNKALEQQLAKDPLIACAVGRRCNADIVIFLNATTRYRGLKPGLSPDPRHLWNARVKMEAISVRETELFSIKTSKAKYQGSDIDDARDEALTKAMDDITDAFIKEILIETNYLNNNGLNIQIRVEGHVTGDTIRAVKSVISGLPGVRQVDIGNSEYGKFLEADAICHYNAATLYNLTKDQMDAKGITFKGFGKNKVIYRTH